MIERILNSLLSCKVIVNCDREPYLHRWYLIRTTRFAVFIHKFIRSDEDRALHDHPWNFFVIPIWRGYIEHSDKACDCGICKNNPGRAKDFPRLPVQRRVWPIISSRYRTGTYRHRVELIKDKPAWSIFIRFKEQRDWGFWPKEGFIQWNKWWQEKCE